ncbi:hypothetical protein J437_LFUL000529, partial [Ladona fulva]
MVISANSTLSLQKRLENLTTHLKEYPESKISAVKKSSEECLAIYKEVSIQIFNQSPLWGTRNLVMSHSYYDTHLFEGLLKKYIGTTLLCKTARDAACPKIAIVSTVVNKPQILAYVFRNYELPYRVTSQYRGSSRHEMGVVALEILKKLEELTGRHAYQLFDLICGVSTGAILTCLLGVHTILHDLLPGGVYFRFNPHLTGEVTIDDARPEFIKQLEIDSAMYIRQNEAMFEEVAAALLTPKSTAQKCSD